MLSRTLTLYFLTVLVTTAAGMAQRLDTRTTSTPADASAPPRRATVSARSASVARGVALVPTARGFAGYGALYSAEFEPRGVSFLPALGKAAPRNLPLRLRTTSIGRTGAVHTAGDVAPRADALHVDFPRRSCVERYDVTVDGIAQSFVFESRPRGTGDLVVTLVVETELDTVERDRDGWRFVMPGVGGVRVGGVTGIAADGSRVSGEIRWAEPEIRLSLPAEFVDSAELPIVLDPVISTYAPVSDNAFEDSTADVSYDNSTNRFFVVWERRNSAVDVDVFGRRMQADGTPYGNLLEPIYTGGGLHTSPVVANVAAYDMHVIAWKGAGGVYGVGYSEANGLTNLVSYSGSVGTLDIAGEVTSTASCAIVVFTETTTNTVRALQFDVTGPTTLAAHGATTLTTTFWHDSNVAISKGGGLEGRYAIAWERRVGTNGSIRAMVVDRHLNVLDSSTIITDGSHNTGFADVDGDGRSWMIAFQRTESPNGTFGPDGTSDIFCRDLHWDENNGQAFTVSGVAQVEAGLDYYESSPSVAFLGESALIAYVQDHDLWGRHVWARSMDPYGCNVCEGEYNLAFRHTTAANVALCAKWSAAPHTWHGGAALAAMSLTDALDGDTDILARLYTARDGVTTDYGGGCGVGGRAEAACGVLDYGGFEMRLRGAEPSAPAWLLVGFELAFIPCGSCILTLQPVLTYSRTTDAAGDARVVLDLPGTPGWVGLELRQQWAVLPVGAGGCDLAGLDFSNGISSRIE